MKTFFFEKLKFVFLLFGSSKKIAKMFAKNRYKINKPENPILGGLILSELVPITFNSIKHYILC